MADHPFRYADRAEGISGSAIREIFRHSAKPGMISFAGGNPASKALPNEQIADIARELLLSQGKVLLQYGQTEGYPPLLEALPPYISETFGVSARREELLVTTGSMQGLDLLCKALINSGDAVLTESPAFLGALQCMNSYQARLIPVPMDDEGLDTGALERLMEAHRPKLLYTIPTFQNPSGLSLTLERRKKVAELAARYGVVVAEDDPYRQLRYAGESLPSIKSFDEAGWVVLLGSFSKVISPGLRIGFLCGDSGLLRKCTVFKQCTDVHSPNLNQAIVAHYLEKDLLKGHIAGILPHYALLLQIMLGALGQMADIPYHAKPEGGLFILAELAEGLDAGELMRISLEKGMVFVPGSPFYPEGGHLNSFRLNFSNASESQILRGMEILGDSIKELKHKRR